MRQNTDIVLTCFSWPKHSGTLSDSIMDLRYYVLQEWVSQRYLHRENNFDLAFLFEFVCVCVETHVLRQYKFNLNVDSSMFSDKCTLETDFLSLFKGQLILH